MTTTSRQPLKTLTNRQLSALLTAGGGVGKKARHIAHRRLEAHYGPVRAADMRARALQATGGDNAKYARWLAMHLDIAPSW